MGTLSAVVFVMFAVTLIVVHRPGNDGFDAQVSPHVPIRCAWAPTCSAGHGITVTTGADPEMLKSASMLAAELREQERELVPRHPQAEVVNRSPVPTPLRSSTERPLSIGFYVDWDDNSYPALKRALPDGLGASPRTDDLRIAHAEWQADPALQQRWVRWVVDEVLGLAHATREAGEGDPEHRVPHLAFQSDRLSDVAILPMGEVVTSYYLRMRVVDQPGVLADITRILADRGISIGAIQRGCWR